MAQKLDQLQPFIPYCIPTGTHGPTCVFWANLTPFSLKAKRAEEAAEAVAGAAAKARERQRRAEMDQEAAQADGIQEAAVDVGINLIVTLEKTATARNMIGNLV